MLFVLKIKSRKSLLFAFLKLDLKLDAYVNYAKLGLNIFKRCKLFSYDCGDPKDNFHTKNRSNKMQVIYEDVIKFSMSFTDVYD